MQGQGKGAFSAVEDAPVGELRAEHRLPSPRLEDMSRNVFQVSYASVYQNVEQLKLNERLAALVRTFSNRKKTQRPLNLPVSAHYKTKFATSRLIAVDSFLYYF